MDTVTRTYPPEVDETRAQIMKMIEDVKKRYEAPFRPPVDATATQISALRAPLTPEECAAHHRAYLAEIDPWIRMLVETEAFAIITIRIPA